mgnify:CR=1 FL=1
MLTIYKKEQLTNLLSRIDATLQDFSQWEKGTPKTELAKLIAEKRDCIYQAVIHCTYLIYNAVKQQKAKEKQQNIPPRYSLANRIERNHPLYPMRETLLLAYSCYHNPLYFIDKLNESKFPGVTKKTVNQLYDYLKTEDLKQIMTASDKATQSENQHINISTEQKKIQSILKKLSHIKKDRSQWTGMGTPQTEAAKTLIHNSIQANEALEKAEKIAPYNWAEITAGRAIAWSYNFPDLLLKYIPALSPIEVKAITEHFSDIDRQKIGSNTVPSKAIQKNSAELIKS